MRKIFFAALACSAAALCAACGGDAARQVADGANRATSATPATQLTPQQTTLGHAPSQPPGAVPPVASGHAAPGSPQSAPAAPAAAGGPDTSALDQKIAAALAKAQAPNASAADKKALAAAYMERGNVFWSAGNPMLYRRALADFNSVLLYQPDNADAQAKRAEIIRIYQSMGRPVPDYSNEKP